MFNRIPSDVSEIVVVYSRTNDVYLEMKEIVEKFKDKHVKERIWDKLTTKIDCKLYIYYELNHCYYRSYGKPYYLLKHSEEYFDVYRWPDNSRRDEKSDLPCTITVRGARHYKRRSVYSVHEADVYSFGYLIINYAGMRRYRFKNDEYSILHRDYN